MYFLLRDLLKFKTYSRYPRSGQHIPLKKQSVNHSKLINQLVRTCKDFKSQVFRALKMFLPATNLLLLVSQVLKIYLLKPRAPLKTRREQISPIQQLIPQLKSPRHDRIIHSSFSTALVSYSNIFTGAASHSFENSCQSEFDLQNKLFQSKGILPISC